MESAQISSSTSQGEEKVVIDAKATGKKFLESIEESDDATRDVLLKEHASAMKERVKELKSKGYRDSVDGDVEAVVMFVPSEALLAITFDFERDLHEFAMKNDILIASRYPCWHCYVQSLSNGDKLSKLKILVRRLKSAENCTVDSQLGQSTIRK